MLNRRQFIGRGLSAFALGLLHACNSRSGSSSNCSGAAGATPLPDSGPFLRVADTSGSIVVDGFPFAPGWTGDPFDVPHPPIVPLVDPPAPSESADVVVVGGGICGLATAYLLRRHRPVVLEFHDRFGGNARGETWEGTRYSLGSAYVIVPDEGTFLDRFYRDLGLDDVFRLSEGGSDPIALDGSIRDDFWSGAGLSSEEADALHRYAEIVRYYAEDRYPDIPLPLGKDNAWILDLDRITLKEDIETRLGGPATPLLAAAIQGYCYSSFGAGWDEISAAGGWNFLAAEEYGRWVFPGGNAWLTSAMWKRLAESDRARSSTCGLRAGCRVRDVRLEPAGVRVSYADRDGALHAISAKQVVMACPKFVCKYVLPDLERLDPEKLAAMHSVRYAAYLVANVLLDAPIERDFYDLFLLGDGHFPMDATEASNRRVIADALSGHFARRDRIPRSVLTLYWPLPWPSARFTLVGGDASWRDYATRLAPQLREMLALLDVDPRSVRQIRMSQWGHALPISAPGLIADGTCDRLRRSIDGRIWFVAQDNWALPAVENGLLDAETFVPEIEARL